MSKTKKTENNKKPKPRPKSAQVGAPEEPPETENREDMDFGGIPKRDLKKNLGCG